MTIRITFLLSNSFFFKSKSYVKPHVTYLFSPEFVKNLHNVDFPTFFPPQTAMEGVSPKNK